MSPDSESSRLARLEQRVETLETVVAKVSPMREAFAELRSDVRHMGENMEKGNHHIEERLGNLETALDHRDQQVSTERRQTRIALWSVVGVLGSAVVTAIGGIVISLISGGGTP